jgi:hypothetical protein
MCVPTYLGLCFFPSGSTNTNTRLGLVLGPCRNRLKNNVHLSSYMKICPEYMGQLLMGSSLSINGKERLPYVSLCHVYPTWWRHHPATQVPYSPHTQWQFPAAVGIEPGTSWGKNRNQHNHHNHHHHHSNVISIRLPRCGAKNAFGNV